MTNAREGWRSGNETTESCGGVEGHAPTCRADIDPAVNRREGRLQQGLQAGLKPSPHDTDLVAIGAEAMLETDIGKMLLARHEAKTLLSAAIIAIEKAGHRIVRAEATDDELSDIAQAIDVAWHKPGTWREIALKAREAMLAAAPRVTQHDPEQSHFIKARLRKLGKTPIDLAFALDLDPPAISKVISGNREVKVRELPAMAAFLVMSLEDLVCALSQRAAA